MSISQLKQFFSIRNNSVLAIINMGQLLVFSIALVQNIGLLFSDMLVREALINLSAPIGTAVGTMVAALISHILGKKSGWKENVKSLGNIVIFLALLILNIFAFQIQDTVSDPCYGVDSFNNNEIGIVITHFKQMSGNTLQPGHEWTVFLKTMRENWMNTREISVVFDRNVIEDNMSAEYLGRCYDARLVIWGSIGTNVVTSYTILSKSTFYQNFVLQPATDVFSGRLEDQWFYISSGGSVNLALSILLGHLYYEDGNYDNAISFYLDAISLMPPSSRLDKLETLHRIAIAHLALKNYSQVHEYLDEIRSIDNSYSLIQNTRGVTYFYEGNYEMAISELESLIESTDSAVSISASASNLAAIHLLLNESYQTLDYIDMAIEANPENPFPYNLKSLVFLRSENYQSALEYANIAIQKSHGEIAEFYIDRGVIKNMFGEYFGSISDFDSALSIDPNSARALANQAVAFSVLGDKSKALMNLNRAIQIFPEYAFSYRERAHIYRSLGNNDQALFDINSAILFNADYVDAYWDRAVLRMEKGDLSGSLADFERFRELGGYHDDLEDAIHALQDRIANE